MMRALLRSCALGVLLLAGVAQGKVAVVAEITPNSQYNGGTEIAGKTEQRQLEAVKAILDRWKADYKVIPVTNALTWFCRTGRFFKRTLGTGFSYDSTSTNSFEQFDAVIHVGFNGTQSSAVTGYRPDSLTVYNAMAVVPQLILINDALAANQSSAFDNATSDSSWVTGNGYQNPGGGSGNHEGEGSTYDAETGTYRWFSAIYDGACLKKSGNPNGGMRVLLASGVNSTMTNTELTGNMPTFVDSLSTANTDTMKVWEKLNLHKSGAARIVFAVSTVAAIAVDSLSGTLLSEVNTYAAQGVNWPVMLFAIAHLDSISNNLVLGKNKVPGFGFVVLGGGTTSDRRHPGGFFLADSSIVAASMDTTKYWGAKMVIAADPESLAARPWQTAIYKRGLVKFAPWVRSGLDSTVAGNGNWLLTSPKDVWGRYRNRAIYGDSVNHAVNGSDSSVYAGIVAARRLLSAQVGGGYVSTALIAPDDDWSPYQMRGSQNHALLDSLLWLTHQLGGPLIINSQDRDREPTYRRTTPVGFMLNEGRYRSSIGNVRARVLAHSGFTVRGSRWMNRADGMSFLSANIDTVPPVCDPGPCPGPNAAVYEENRFWNGFFGPSRDYQFNSYDGIGGVGEGTIIPTKDRLYGQQRASVLFLPAQSFGGQDATAPNRWGAYVVKHIMAATIAINRKAGRTIIANQFPEDIEP